MTYTATLFNPVQAETTWREIWPKVKAALTGGQRLELVIKKEKRSAKQNRRYWGRGILAQITEQATPNGKRYDAETWHEQFKRMFIGVIELPNGEVIGMSSADLDKGEFSEFCTKVEAYAATELGVRFMDLPND